MRSPAVALQSRESLYLLARILLETSYSGFPIVETNEETGDEVIYGLITRSTITSVWDSFEMAIGRTEFATISRMTQNKQAHHTTGSSIAIISLIISYRTFYCTMDSLIYNVYIDIV